MLKSDSLLLLGLLVLRLLTHDTTTPSSSNGDVVVVLSLESLSESLQRSSVFLANGGQAHNSGVLLVDQSTESSLALENAEWDILLSAKSWEPADEFDWIDIVGNNNKLRLLILDQRGDLMNTVLDGKRLLLVTLLTSSLGFSDLLETSLLLLGSLWRILLQELQQFTSLVLVESVCELIDHWWNLNSLEKNLLLALESDVLGPSDISSHIPARLDIVSDIVVSLHHSNQSNKRVF